MNSEVERLNEVGKAEIALALHVQIVSPFGKVAMSKVRGEGLGGKGFAVGKHAGDSFAFGFGLG